MENVSEVRHQCSYLFEPISSKHINMPIVKENATRVESKKALAVDMVALVENVKHSLAIQTTWIRLTTTLIGLMSPLLFSSTEITFSG